MKSNSRIYVAGHQGLVGSALVRCLRRQGYTNLILRSRAELDLLDAKAVTDFFAEEQPVFVFLAAAKVGGILANSTYSGDFIRDNLILQTNLIEASRVHKVNRLLFLGSSCIYPKLCPQPIKEEYLLTGPLEPTNRSYAIAKIAGIEMCWSYNRQFGTKYLAAMPTNLYGPGDNFDLDSSHVLPALIRKTGEAMAAKAAKVSVWGSGDPRRELLYCDDLADACIFLMNLQGPHFDSFLCEGVPPLINIGTGEDLSIRDLAKLVFDVLGFRGQLVLDATKPDGTPRKVLDVSRLHELGWRHTTSLEQGIRLTWESIRDQLILP